MPVRRVEPLPAEVFEFLAGVLPEGTRVAGISQEADALQTASAVDEAVRRCRNAQPALSDAERAGLGVLWGKAVSQATGWTWARIVEGDTRLTCLVAQDHAHACAPLAFIQEQLEASTPCTVLVLFELIRQGNLPAAKLEELVFVG